MIHKPCCGGGMGTPSDWPIETAQRRACAMIAGRRGRGGSGRQVEADVPDDLGYPTMTISNHRSAIHFQAGPDVGPLDAFQALGLQCRGGDPAGRDGEAIEHRLR